MAYVRDGDELVVSSIDRLARSLTDLRGIVDELTDKGVTVTFCTRTYPSRKALVTHARI